LQTENQLLGINDSGIIESDEEGRARAGREEENFNSATKLLTQKESARKKSNEKPKETRKKEPAEF